MCMVEVWYADNIRRARVSEDVEKVGRSHGGFGAGLLRLDVVAVADEASVVPRVDEGLVLDIVIVKKVIPDLKAIKHGINVFIVPLATVEKVIMGII
ncbi:unnamed protein product [Chondrus crispus]|uniref:Uncharacterized protein n=1 Tax=Chondrus crispus TaxID=2769 RepID=R7QSD3_CHOCR|nr:unnamed protein product [Chondrus crispus]CDF40300.1 unnamed protein product [Chondrus crispus]|eukprot:XP_005710594.1 unnamed protein product [Chondrus crispus]